MPLRFDPGQLDQFKSQIRSISGYPAGEELPIRNMVFESGALWRLPDLLPGAGIKLDQTLSVIMDPTLMLREGQNLKDLVLKILKDAGYQVDVIWLEPDHTGQIHTDFLQINHVKARLKKNSPGFPSGSGFSFGCPVQLIDAGLENYRSILS